MALVESTIQKAEITFSGQISKDSKRTLVGFSLGAFVALDVAQRSEGHWTNLLLIGAKIEPDARQLKKSGVRSVLLASGDYDMMKRHMVDVAERLARSGIRSRFIGMGKVGHTFARDMDQWLTSAQRWFDGEDGA